MTGKTHIVIGIAAAYAVTMPKTVTEFAVATVGGSIGGVMADIDVKIDTSNKFAAKNSLDALYGEILAVAISVSALAGEFFAEGTIVQKVINNWQRSAIGAALFIVLTVLGELSTHRDKTHSLLALVLFSTSVFLIDPRIGLAFLIGYGTHLVIDLFNKQPIRLLYPAEKGFCFKFIYADRLGNELFLVAGASFIALYITFLHSLMP